MELDFILEEKKLFMEKTENFNLNEMTLKAQQEKDERINKLKISVNEKIDQVPTVQDRYKFLLIFEACGMVDYSHLIGDISVKERSSLKRKLCEVMEDILGTKKRIAKAKAGLQNV